MVLVRYATRDDQAALLDIYNHYVQTAMATFDEEPRTLVEQKMIFARYRPFGPYRMLVAEDDGQVLGMASSNPYRPHAAFKETVEASVYLAPEARARGLGTALYQSLFRELRFTPLHRVLAGIALPNEASVQLHRKVGFHDVGIFDEYARKNGQYISSLWMQRPLECQAAPAVTRRAVTGDQNAIRSLIDDVLHEYGLNPDQRGTDHDLGAMEEEYFQAEAWFAVAVSAEGKIIGSWALHKEEMGVCELRKMYLHPSVRGRGLGKYLLEDALRKATDMGYRRVVLKTASVLKEAIALYGKYGFRPYNPAHGVSACCDQFLGLDLTNKDSLL